jgi:hypothetical protein
MMAFTKVRLPSYTVQKVGPEMNLRLKVKVVLVPIQWNCFVARLDWSSKCRIYGETVFLHEQISKVFFIFQ